MLEHDPTFRPVRTRDGYLPLEDLGLIGDGSTAALVGLDGSISWLCLPRFDSEPLFCGLLDRDHGGHFSITPDGLTEARQRYEPDTGVLVTELRTAAGVVRLTDALALRPGADLTDDVPAGRGELVRSAVVLDGSVQLRVDLEPRGGAQARAAASGLLITPARRQDLRLHLRSSRPLSGLHGALVPLTLTTQLDPPELRAYGRLLQDVLSGNAALSIRGDEAEQSWRVLTPVLSAWTKDLVPLEEYPAGSDGPGPRQPDETGLPGLHRSRCGGHPGHGVPVHVMGWPRRWRRSSAQVSDQKPGSGCRCPSQRRGLGSARGSWCRPPRAAVPPGGGTGNCAS